MDSVLSTFTPGAQISNRFYSKGLAAVCAFGVASYAPLAVAKNLLEKSGNTGTLNVTELSNDDFWHRGYSDLKSTLAAPRFEALIETRATSDHERSIAAIRSWGALDANWDGEGAAAPSENSIRVAAEFICNLDRKKMAPVEMLHANGRIGLLWDEEDLELYGEIEFISEHRIAYFFQNSEGKHKGELTYSGGRVSEIFQALIPDEYAS